MGCSCDEILTLLLLGSACGLIVSGIYVTKPNLHGINFGLGVCNLSSVETISDWDNLPDCSCGKGCSEKYPCITLRGYFAHNGTAATPGIFYEDYGALSKHCLHVPSCNTDFEENAISVYRYYEDTVIPLVNDTRYPLYWINDSYFNFTNVEEFECWGYDNIMYFENNYSIILVYVSLIGPGILFLASLALSIGFGSDSHRSFVKCIALAPFYILIAIFGVLKEICCSCIPRQDILELCRKCLKCRNTAYEDEDYQPSSSVQDHAGISSRGNAGLLDLSPRGSNSPVSRGDSIIARPDGVGITMFPTAPIVTSVEECNALPPPPSYNEAVSSGIAVDAPAPSYEDVIRNSTDIQY